MPHSKKIKIFKVLSAVFVLGLISMPIWAADLLIGLGSEPTTMDPHFYNLGPNTEITETVFDALVDHDKNLNPVPALAESWSVAEDGLTWTFKLRKGVKFHDGTPFTSKDVVHTFERVPKVLNSPSSFEKYLRLIETTTIVDDYTLRIKTKITSPELLNDLEQLNVIPAKLGILQADAYNTGKAMIGTGPYKFVEWKRGDRVVVEASKNYWGGKPSWDRVTLKAITNNAARTAAILAGDADVIGFVPTVDIQMLKKNPNVKAYQRAGNRLLYFHIDQQKRPSPHVWGIDGKRLTVNPLADMRVRKAISTAIDRGAIVNRIMDGVGIKASGFMADHFLGANPDLKPEPYDLEGAKKLLAEAGYPNGFRLTVHGPNDRYPNDAKVVQAVAQMLTQIGIDAKVETYPKNVYFGKASKLEFSMMLVGSSGNSRGELAAYIVYTWTPKKGLGAVNRGRYSNARVDELLKKARVELTAEKRAAYLREMEAIAIGQDQAIIPILYFVNSWAARKGFVMEPHASDITRPDMIKPES